MTQPTKEQKNEYQRKQDAWVEGNNVVVGTQVKVTRKAHSRSGGGTIHG